MISFPSFLLPRKVLGVGEAQVPGSPGSSHLQAAVIPYILAIPTSFLPPSHKTHLPAICRASKCSDAAFGTSALDLY